MQKIMAKIPIKKLILEQFTKETGKIFYSFEVTPKKNFILDTSKIHVKPLFIDITWISDYNLKHESILSSQAFALKKELEKIFNVVNTISCYRLDDKHVEELLSEQDTINYLVIRGDNVNGSQKYKYAGELVKEIRRRTQHIQDNVTIMGACYPNVHPETTDYNADMKNLKRKVDEGVDVLLTQSVFCSKIFCRFVKNCRKEGIMVPIIPGIYIPYTYEELKSIIRTTQVSVPTELAREFKHLSKDQEKFQALSINVTKTMIQEIQDQCIDHIPGYHFFSMNNMTMINKLLQVMNFSEAS